MNEANIELRNIIEAALLVAGRPLTVDRLAALFPEDSRPTRDDVHAKFQEAKKLLRGFKLSLSPIYQEFLRGERDLKCAAWANPTSVRPMRASRLSSIAAWLGAACQLPACPVQPSCSTATA